MKGITYRKDTGWPFRKNCYWAVYNHVCIGLYRSLPKAKRLAPKRLEYLRQHGESRIKKLLNQAIDHENHCSL